MCFRKDWNLANVSNRDDAFSLQLGPGNSATATAPTTSGVVVSKTLPAYCSAVGAYKDYSSKK